MVEDLTIGGALTEEELARRLGLEPASEGDEPQLKGWRLSDRTRERIELNGRGPSGLSLRLNWLVGRLQSMTKDGER